MPRLERLFSSKITKGMSLDNVVTLLTRLLQRQEYAAARAVAGVPDLSQIKLDWLMVDNAVVAVQNTFSSKKCLQRRDEVFNNKHSYCYGEQ